MKLGSARKYWGKRLANIFKNIISPYIPSYVVDTTIAIITIIITSLPPFHLTLGMFPYSSLNLGFLT